MASTKNTSTEEKVPEPVQAGNKSYEEIVQAIREYKEIVTKIEEKKLSSVTSNGASL